MWEGSDKQNKTRAHRGLGNDQNFASSFATLRQEANSRDSSFSLMQIKFICLC